jgi:hypothetical protein
MFISRRARELDFGEIFTQISLIERSLETGKGVFYCKVQRSLLLLGSLGPVSTVSFHATRLDTDMW